ncbi:MAG: bifunctional ornithine acetyltransferase/N-acetylglutamate synthase [Leptospiraceae bacterium]|nr:bifunctional ornithine acetyltransferase/N-acetylglutamate synthase [Leptospiraceae bacterium]MDW7976371.1 bifunctional ornithine acetyltransferase/N-acetylglutamate synthase [Leptospiraceae bacterium]
MELPKGFYANGWYAGIKKNTNSKDFGFIFSETLASASGVFTQNKFVGNPIIVGREHIKNGKLQCIVVNSGNSNVATGREGLKLAYDTCKWTAKSLKIKPEDVLPSSTGVIGKKLDSKVIENACSKIPHYLDRKPLDFAEAILTTDRFPKTGYYSNEAYTIAGFAKGAGMIHPNMATMLAYIITDVKISSSDLRRLIHFVANKTFNRISVDSDTSTSDTFVIMANGKSKQAISYPIEEWKKLFSFTKKQFLLLINYSNEENKDLLKEVKREVFRGIHFTEESKDFLLNVLGLSMQLAKKIVSDGEGSTKIFRVNVLNAPTAKIAEKIGRSIINSPLIKTAIFGGDPNWGRFLMGIGKVVDAHFDISKIKLYCNQKEFYPKIMDLEEMSEYFKQKEIYIDIDLNQGNANESFWGCDLNYDYVKINSEYTT